MESEARPRAVVRKVDTVGSQPREVLGGGEEGLVETNEERVALQVFYLYELLGNHVHPVDCEPVGPRGPMPPPNLQEVTPRRSRDVLGAVHGGPVVPDHRRKDRVHDLADQTVTRRP